MNQQRSSTLSHSQEFDKHKSLTGKKRLIDFISSRDGTDKNDPFSTDGSSDNGEEKTFSFDHFEDLFPDEGNIAWPHQKTTKNV